MAINLFRKNNLSMLTFVYIFLPLTLAVLTLGLVMQLFYGRKETRNTDLKAHFHVVYCPHCKKNFSISKHHFVCPICHGEVEVLHF